MEGIGSRTRSKTGHAEPHLVEQPKRGRGAKRDEGTTATKGRRGKKAKVQEEPKMLEKGLIYFFYRPKVGVEEVNSLNEVQRLHLVLWPEAPTMAEHEGKPGKLRVIGISKKALPSPKSHQINFAFVEKITDSVDDIKKDLGKIDYETPVTEQERHIEGARPLGEGVYSLVKHGDHSHLAYVLEQPQELKPVHQAFGLRKEESMIISVKNPEMIEGETKPHYPTELQNHFRGVRKKSKKFAPVEDPELLNYEGAQVLLIGSSDDLVQEFGEVGEKIEEIEQMDAEKISDYRLFEELHLKRKENPPQPLLEGTWK